MCISCFDIARDKHSSVIAFASMILNRVMTSKHPTLNRVLLSFCFIDFIYLFIFNERLFSKYAIGPEL